MSIEGVVGGIIVVIIALYVLGSTLIDVYFNRKSKFVDNLYQKTKGSVDGKSQ